MNGTVITIGGIAGIMMTSPAGAPVDATNKKRLFVVLPGICTFLAAAIILYSRQLWVVAAYGAMLPLYGWAAASKKAGDPSMFVAMTVAVAQLVMVFTSIIASTALSPSLGGWLVHFIGYNSTFLLLGGFAIASIILWTSGYKFLQESCQPAC